MVLLLNQPYYHPLSHALSPAEPTRVRARCRPAVPAGSTPVLSRSKSRKVFPQSCHPIRHKPVSKSWPRAVVPFPDSQPPTGVIRRTSFWRCPLYYNWERVFCRGVGLWLAWLGFVNQIESGVRLECSMTKDQPLILPSVGRVQGQGTWQKHVTPFMWSMSIYIYMYY